MLQSKELNSYLEEELANLHEQNVDLSMELQSLEAELSSTCTEDTTAMHEEVFTFQTKVGRRYSPSIRKLYYTLLSAGLPAIKISSIIKHVLQTFNPTFDTSSLSQPQRTCSSYMRKEELKVIGDAQKATKLCDPALMNQGFHLNSDGTTKHLKKLGAVAINSMAISTNELPDGTADSVIDDVSKELKRLRDIARKLKLPNPDSINWTMIVSSTSDSAATQKRLNKLIEERREADEKQFGPVAATSIDLIENFCSMHLAVNLRKAFLNGIGNIADDSRQRHLVDTVVHEFCKLFGRYGVPEYSSDATFADFLALMSHDADTAELHSYYQSCTAITLERQVGSRYFVSAANGVRIVFLKEAALHFLKYTGKAESGNKLETSVNEKLSDPAVISCLKADSFMYYHIYADLVMLSKSTDLDKSAYDMNAHYLELQLYLQEIEKNPAVVLDRDYRVFWSEERLYSDDKKVNHRCHTKSQCLYDHLFASASDDTLLQLLAKGAVKMREKLGTYARNCLPGGKYWQPEPDVKNVLMKIKPSNDICESILGLNDYLTNAIPNLHQASRSNLVSVKKNKAMEWLDKLPGEQQLEVLDLAVESRKLVREECKEMEKETTKKRLQNLKQAHIRREALKQKAELEKERLSNVHLVTSSEELHEGLANIDRQNATASQKRALKLSFMRTQVSIRKKVLGQTIRIVFSKSGRQRPLTEIISELADYIDVNPFENAIFIKNPSSLVGKRIIHKFELPDGFQTIKWYSGMVLDYNAVNKVHTVMYDGEEDECYFHLASDILNGDLKVQS